MIQRLLLIIFSLSPIFLLGQNVGIGTTTPEAPLHITDSVSGAAQPIKLQGNSPFIGFYGLNNSYKGYLWNNGDGMQLGTSNSSSPITIAPGFNTTATFMPNGLVTVQGQEPLIGLMKSTDTNYKGFISYPDTALIIGTAAGSNKPLVLAPNNSTLIYADHNQKVGIGTTFPVDKLTVNGNIKADSFKFSTPRISYYNINTPDFTSRDGSFTISRELGAGYASIDQNDPLGLGMVTSINLPHGSKITHMKIVGRDDSPTSNLKVDIISRSYSSLSPFTWVTQTSSSSPGNFTIDHTLASPIPVENDLSYHILLVTGTNGWNGSQLGIYSVRLTYIVEHAE